MMILKPISPTDFDKFATSHEAGNWLQTSAMAAFRSALGWETHLIGAFENKSLIATVLLAAKAGRYEVTMGPLLDYANTEDVTQFFSLLSDFVKEQGGYLLEVYPAVAYTTRDSAGKIIEGPHPDTIADLASSGYRHKGFTTDYDPVANRWVYVKDLSAIASEEQLLLSYRQTTRQIIKKFDQKRYSVKRLAKKELTVLKQLVDSSNDKNHVPSRPLSYYEHLFDSLGEAVEFLVVYYDNTIPLSGAVFIHHPNETVYFLSGTATEHRQLYGAHYLQHYAMLAAVHQGQKRYNFYGIAGHFTHNPLLVYKAGFRGYIEEYIGGFSKVVNTKQYMKKRLLSKVKTAARKVLK